MKMLAVLVLVILGVLAAITAGIYLAVPIHSLPSFIPGKHPVTGHYHKRGAAAAAIALVLFVAAGFLAIYFRRTGTSGGARSRSSASPSAGVPPAQGEPLGQ
jgi:hypothetical protein